MKIHTRSSDSFLAHVCPPGTQCVTAQNLFLFCEFVKISTYKILPSLWLISLAPYVKGFFLAPGRREAKENRDFATGGGSFLPNFPDLYFFWAPLLAAFLLAAEGFLGKFLLGGTLLFELSSKCCIPSNCSCWEEYEPENQMISTLKVRTIIGFQVWNKYSDLPNNCAANLIIFFEKNTPTQ